MLFRLTLILLGWLLPFAAAHPMDSLNQAAYITLQPQKVSIELDFTPGELVAAQFVQEFDGKSLNLETLQKFTQKLLKREHFRLDEKEIDLKLEFAQSQIPDLALLKSGGAQLQLLLIGDLPNVSGKHQFVFENKYQPVKSAYAANVFVESKDVQIIQQSRDSNLQVFRVDFQAPQNSNFAWWWVVIAVGLIAVVLLIARPFG